MYNWNRIKAEISVNIEKTFSSSIQPSYVDFQETLELFFKVIHVKCNNMLIDGLTRSVLPALSQAYITDKGTINPLKILAEELEPFYKKLLLLILNHDHTQDKSKTLGPLMEELHLSTIINSRSVGFSELFKESNLLIYKGQDEYIEFLCHAYLIRNQVHNSPNWDYIDIFTNLRSILVAYLYPVQKYKSELTASIARYIQINAPEIEVIVDNHTKALYEFISLGNNTIEIKKQIINSSILYYLLSKGEASVEDIMNYCNEQFNSDGDKAFYIRTTKSLQSEKKVIQDSRNKDLLKLTESETERLKRAIENFDFLEKNFSLSVQQVLNTYSLGQHTNEVMMQLKCLLEANYDIDLYEIYSQISEATNSDNCSKFIKYLDSITRSKDYSRELFFHLLRLCEENDILHKLSASKVISGYINSNQLQNYLRLQERVVYMDTQIILYVLCAYYKEVKEYNIYYDITRDLLRYSAQNPNVSLHVSQFYVFEAAYHFKEALLLIPFEELSFFGPKNSHNVFFQFYEYLSNNELLDDETNSFEDFLRGYRFEYEDVFSSSFIQIAAGLIAGFLESFGIVVETIHKPINQAHDEVFEIFKNALNTLGRPRLEATIENDSSMLYYLTNKYNSNQEPFFITWDHSFYEARKKYLAKFRGCKNFFLYTPSKLLTNLSLTKFEINPDSVTKEFLSILDADDIQSKTNQFLDIINQLFDIDKEERRKYMAKIKEFKEKYIIDQGVQSDEGSIDEKTQPYSALLHELAINVTRKKSKISLDSLKTILSDEKFFEPLTQIFDKELEYYTHNFKFSDMFIEDVSSLIKLKNKQ